MQEILTAAYDNWLLIFLVAVLIVLSFCQGYIISAKRHIADLDRHLEWLRSHADDWRTVAMMAEEELDKVD